MNQRRYPEIPMSSVSAVVVGSRGVLLIKREKEPNKGMWSIPGGVVEIGETQEESIKREVREEAGVDSIVISFINTGDVIYYDSEGSVEYQYMINRYLMRAITDDPHPGPEESEAKWFHPDSLPTEAMPDHLSRIFEEAKEQVNSLIAECKKLDAEIDFQE
ncbi:MAG: NUDIX hydrolase [Candidatus Kariarchaeaceae archaeon]